jgi:transposase
MTEIDAEVVRRLVIRHKNDGRAVYDPQANAQVVQACKRPGVSVARMALQCGINVNLLRRWIAHSVGVPTKSNHASLPAVATAGGAAFVALELAAPKAIRLLDVQPKMGLNARLPNGVEIELRDAASSHLQPVLEALNRLPCSDSKTR